MKLKSLLPEQKEIRYIKPNFDSEWEEAERYPEFVDMGRMEWIKRGKSGYIVKFSDIKNILGNVDLNFDELNPKKKKFVLQYINDGLVEYPIVVKFSDTDYDLVAGNTRLSGLVKFGYNPKLWVVDISDIFQK
jgi:hypothetical protein